MGQLFLARTHVARLNTPHIRICIPLGLVDRRVKPTVGAQAVLVDDTVHIFQNFRLRWRPFDPSPVSGLWRRSRGGELGRRSRIPGLKYKM